MVFAERVPGVTEHAGDSDLRRLLGEIVDRADTHGAVLGRSGLDVGGDENLWMAGILDDAERDTRTIEAGRELDIAMIGAIRKALAAAIVSYQTAIALGGKFEVLHDELVAFDAQLRELLRTIAR